MPKKNSRVCSLHFKENDYREKSKDPKKSRKNKVDADGLQIKLLRSNAVPSVFPKLPEYYNTPLPEKRSETTSNESRLNRQFEAAEIAADEYLKTFEISSLKELEEKIKDETNFPRDIRKLKGENKLTLYSLEENEAGRPSVKYSLVIFEDLKVSMWSNEVKVPQYKIKDLCKNEKVVLSSNVLEILVRLKNMSEERKKVATPKDTIEYCSKLLTEIIPELDESTGRKILFVKEQLSLSIVVPHARRYSPDLLTCCVLWENTSPALFKLIHNEGVLTTPHPKYVKSLSRPFKVDTGMTETNKKYLETRISNLSDQQKVVNLMVDEVYTSKRVEYVGGTYYGYENQTVSKTILSFMVKSLGGKYMDMACLIPVDKMDADILNSIWRNVLKELTEIGFDVVCNNLDGHSANRKFYKELLCKGNLETSIPHPFKDNSMIYILFDRVHCFKCMYNNFINKRKFICPDWDGEKVAPDVNHIEKLQNLEMGKPLKYAHKLNDKVLHPMPIEKTNVKLADALFHESTIAGLDHYSKHGYPEFKDTAIFLRIVRTWWNISNVKGLHAEQRNRDPVRNAIVNFDDWQDFGGLEYMQKFANWIKKWQEMKERKTGLSHETFMTVQHTSLGLIAVCLCLLDEKGFKFVLLGFIDSDPIERRFGWYRQLCGANYFLSVRQFLEAEKKIRLQSLIKFTKLSFKEACEVLKSAQNPDDTLKEAKDLLAMIGFDFTIEFKLDVEQGILYYVAGYCARGEAMRLKCESCLCLFAKSKESPVFVLSEDLGDKRDEFLNMVNRGGLYTPSDAMYICTVYAYQLFMKIMDGGEIQKKFLSFQCQRSVFTACLELKMNYDSSSLAIMEQTCQAQEPHKFSDRISSIGQRLFNTFSKNFVREIEDKTHKDKPRKRKGDTKASASARKIAKLQSSSK